MAELNPAELFSVLCTAPAGCANQLQNQNQLYVSTYQEFDSGLNVHSISVLALEKKGHAAHQGWS